jgi:hypothetical protein
MSEQLLKTRIFKILKIMLVSLLRPCLYRDPAIPRSRDNILSRDLYITIL